MAKSPSIKNLAIQFLLQHAGEIVTRERVETYVCDARGTRTAGEVTRRCRRSAIMGHI